MALETIPDLAFEIEGDQINLEQNAGCGDVDRVTLHRIQLLHLAQRMSLVREMSASDADNLRTAPPTLAEMVRDLDRMKRNMLRIRAYAVDLQIDFSKNADWDHADLSHEMGRINSLVNLMDMALDDFPDDPTVIEPIPPEASPPTQLEIEA